MSADGVGIILKAIHPERGHLTEATMEIWLILGVVVLALIVLVAWRRRGAHARSSSGERTNITDNHAGGVSGGTGMGL